MRKDYNERKDELLNSGLELFSQQSYETLSVDKIVKAAKISKGLLFHYFSSKKGFFIQVLEMAQDSLYEQIEKAVKGKGELSTQLAVKTYLEYISKFPKSYLFILKQNVGQDEDITSSSNDFRKKIVELIVAERDLNKSVELEALIMGWISFLESLAVTWLTEKSVSKKFIAEQATNTLESILESDWK